jgi:hypothetical protein
MALVHLRFQPDVEVEVSDGELAWLARWDLLVEPGADLYVQWLTYDGGPPALVTDVSLSITDDADDVVGGTAAPRPAGDGLFYYRWPTADQPGAGTYTATWTATDAQDAEITAAESFTV